MLQYVVFFFSWNAILAMLEVWRKDLPSWRPRRTFIWELEYQKVQVLRWASDSLLIPVRWSWDP